MMPLSVLHVVRGMKNSSGTTHIVTPLAEEQARLGHDVSVWFCRQGDQPPVTPDPALVASRMFEVSLPLDNPGVSLSFARAIRGDIRAFDFVHVHAIWNFPTFYTLRSAANAGVPSMVAPQGSFEPWAMTWHGGRKALYARHVELPQINRATFVQALTATEAEQIRQAGVNVPYRIIPNGVDLKRFMVDAVPLAQRLRLPAAERTLLSLSRLHPKKGIDTLIAGFARFAQDNPGVTLVIAGHDAGTSYLDTLQAVAAAEGIGARVRFIGEVQGDDKYHVLRGADAFALISHSEGLPVAVLEAMAARLPVLISPGCNLPEVEQAGAGTIVREDAAAVADALRAMFSDRARLPAMGANARRLVEDRFTWRRIAEQTLAVYQEALAAREWKSA